MSFEEIFILNVLTNFPEWKERAVEIKTQHGRIRRMIRQNAPDLQHVLDMHGTLEDEFMKEIAMKAYT